MSKRKKSNHNSDNNGKNENSESDERELAKEEDRRLLVESMAVNLPEISENLERIAEALECLEDILGSIDDFIAVVIKEYEKEGPKALVKDLSGLKMLIDAVKNLAKFKY